MKLFFTLIFSCLYITILSQNISDKQINKSNLSQAYTAQTGNIESFISGNKQWTGITGSPQNQYLHISSGIATRSGVGFFVNNYQTGNFRTLTANITFSHKIELSKKSKLLFGINTSLENNQLEISKIKSTGIDPVLSNISTLKTNIFNVGAGISYSYKKFHTGVSSFSLTAFSGQYVGTSEKFTKNRHYVFHAFYNYETENYLTIEPLFLLEADENNFSETLNWQISVLAKYDKQIFAGISYSKNSSVGFTLGGALTNHIVGYYNYKFGLSGIVANSQGSHEITLAFLIKRKKAKCEGDIFPVTKKEEFKEKRDEEIQKVNENIDNLKIKFNRIISKYEDRLRELEKNKNNLNKNNTGSRTKIVVLSNIKFAVNSPKLFSSSEPELHKIIIKMVKNPNLKIIITVFAGNSGSESFIFGLSKQRANAIKNFLTKNGIEKSRILTQPTEKSKYEKVEIQYFK